MKKNYTPNKREIGYDFNIFGAFDLSVNQLNPHHQKLLRSLGVFKVADIPFQSIISLWVKDDISEFNVRDILEILCRRSLLKIDNKGRQK